MTLISPFRKDLLTDKVVLITGGGSGIGLEIAKQIKEHGAKIAIMGRRKEVLEQAANELSRNSREEVLTLPGDVRNPEQCQIALNTVSKHYGRLDILVNGAAGNFLCPPEELSSNGFKAVVDIDLNGTFHMCRFAFDLLRSSKGVILNISATLHYQGTPMQLHVSCAKAGIDALTQNLAAEWGEHGIRVVGIAPGPIADTEGMKRLVPLGIDKKIAQIIPLKRLGNKIDIAYAAVFLLSDASSYITGETLVVDGGQWLYKPPFISKEIYCEQAKIK